MNTTPSRPPPTPRRPGEGRGLRRSLARLPWLAGCASAIATALGSLGACHWALDLFAHFRGQYALLLALALAASLWQRRWWRVLAMALALSWNLVALAPLYLGAERPHADAGAGAKLEITLFNVYIGNGDYTGAIEYLRAQSPAPDLLVILEPSPRWLEPLAAAFPEYRMLAEERRDPYAMAVLAREPVVEARLRQLTAAPIPAAEVVLRRGDSEVAVLAVHPPAPLGAELAAERDAQLAAAAEWVAGQTRPSVVVGDMNATYWSHPLRGLLARGLRSSQRGFGLQPTWPRSLWPLRIPIDQLLHSRELRTMGRSTGPFLGSDHRPLHVTLALPSP
ncbi:endonuclease/exonuclease/phosphatase family protein [Haliangium ochraceum]|uniref:Endonuclease/exonuclease/phosphatase n=1 Tax=Haliangium ochraceum (strain DSM 14365 / JCM 11303 / SMP-2) TaxID=502025 RepID=D0LKU2_HALO1|nr:endonuclease/exonuclease/phosphatase family protein [Haliangium ochraceum]ACY16662.1 Endonuclease/exonuclease/phosphatase [Haliangium ochraceum DSM 14365]